MARHLGVQGPVETISSACASGALAIEQALRAVRDSEVDVALAGGADCLCVTTYSGFNSLRAIDERPCRPFRSDRAGLSLGEGGAVLVLERIEHARARGARPLAEIVGAGSSCDAHHMTAPQAGGEGAALAVQRALDDAGLEPGDVDFINAHGTGTPLNDAAEYSAFVSLFGDAFRHLPIEATKSSIGHLLGTSGAIEAMAAVLSLVEAQVHPAPAGGVLDPKLLVDLVLEKSRPLPEIRTGLSTSFGFGGANAAVIFRRWEEAA